MLVSAIFRQFDCCFGLFDICFTEYGTALTTVLPILFLYLNTVIVTAGTFEKS
jgi:hypothetical protein